MTETPQAPPHEAPPDSGTTAPSGGWNTDHLKDYRALRRSRDDRKVAGVAGGLGRHLDIDPTIVRVLLVVLVFFGAAGLVLYGVLWLLVPEEGTDRAAITTGDSTRNALLISALVVAVLLAFGDSWLGYGFPWPLAIGAVVFAAILMSRDRRGGGRPPMTPIAPAEPAAAAPLPRDPRRTGPLLFGFTSALVALALGILGLYDASGGSVTDDAYPALALAVIGAMLAVGAFFGRAGGLILLGLAAVVVLGGTAIANPSYDGDRDLVLRPTSAADLAGGGYDVPAGRIELDLTELRDPEALDGRTLTLEANVGEILVTVPEDLDVSYGARVDFGGAIETPDGSRDGWGPSLNGELDGGEDSAGQLDLEMDLEFGQIELRQR